MERPGMEAHIRERLVHFALLHLCDKRRLFSVVLATIVVSMTSCSLATPKESIKKADQVVVVKSESRLYLLHNGAAYAHFDVSLGRAWSSGPKHESGDHHTPEGHYVLDYRNDQSEFYKSIHVSYPNASDRAWSETHNHVPLGGDIMIHGQKNGYGWAAPITQMFNWTNGCIGLSNDDLDVVWDSWTPNLPIDIVPDKASLPAQLQLQ